MYAAALRVELRVRDARSLKDKRRTLKPLMADLKRTFEASVAEVDHQDLWNRATLGIAVVSPQEGLLSRFVFRVERWLESRPDVEVLGTAVSHLEKPA